MFPAFQLPVGHCLFPIALVCTLINALFLKLPLLLESSLLGGKAEKQTDRSRKGWTAFVDGLKLVYLFRDSKMKMANLY